MINKRAYDLDVQDRSYTVLTPGMAAIKSRETGLYNVYDLFTGELLLPYAYERVGFAADCLYVYRDGGWAVFHASMIQ